MTTDVSSMPDELGFPFDQCVSLDSYTSYQKQYETVKNYVDNEWNILLPTESSPIPRKCAKIKWLIRHGIPMNRRAKLWYEYSGAASEQKSEPELFSLLIWKEAQDLQSGYSTTTNQVLSFVEMIDQDLERTFPNHPKFQTKLGLLSSLRKILVAFAYYSFPHPVKAREPIRTCTYQIGYCQSLNFIVAFLLLVFFQDEIDQSDEERDNIEEKVFWMLIIIVEKLMPLKMYGSDIKGARNQQQVLWNWIIREHGESFGLAKLSKWLKEIDQRLDPFLSISTGWFMNLFINIFPNDTTLRILDCLFYQGEKTLYRAAVGFFQIYQVNIIGFHDWFDACRYIKNAPKRMINSHNLFEKMYKKFHPVEVDAYHDHVWVGLSPIQSFSGRRESVEDLEYTPSSHLNKHVLSHARLCLKKDIKDYSIPNAKAAFETVSNIFYENVSHFY